MSHSHKTLVPTARPPAAKRRPLYLWGRGTMGAALQSYLRHTDARVERDDLAARQLAVSHGCPLGLVGDAWAARIEGADEHEVDRLTRDDPSIMGWTNNPRESIAASVALRNLLSTLSNDEYRASAPEFIKRFAKAHVSSEQEHSDRWIARDRRVVYRDPDDGAWQLGEYAGGERS